MADHPRVLALIHVAHEPLGRLEQWLDAAGVAVTTALLSSTQCPASLDGYAGLIVMGGPQSACGPDHEPFPHERDLIREAVALARPYLGICLGAQLLAACLGGKVEPASSGEYGLGSVSLLDRAANDPLLAGLDPVSYFPQWHGDQVTVLPSGSHLLATGEVCTTQAFRIGNAWGLQFHPEATGEIVAGWSRADGIGDPVEHARAVDSWRADGRVDAHWERAMTRFAALLAS